MNSRSPSTLHSLLFESPPQPSTFAPSPPDDAFVDLHLTEIIRAATNGHPDHHLDEIYRRPLAGIDAITYRHEVFRDLADDGTRTAIATFTSGLREVRTLLDQRDRLHLAPEARLWHLYAVRCYSRVLRRFRDALHAQHPTSRALRAMDDNLSGYLESSGFSTLADRAEALHQRIMDLRFVVLSDGNRLTVGPFDHEPDYTQEILDTFARFRHGEHPGSDPTSARTEPLDRVGGILLSLVAQIFPSVFEELARFHEEHHTFITDQVATYEHDAEFYLGYLNLIQPMRKRGMAFTLPEIHRSPREEHVTAMTDMALAHRRPTTLVTNDYHLATGEQMLAISGPNQGGKTTTARTIGQLHYLSRIGVPVAAQDADLLLVDRVFTHFERSESIETLTGKLEDELLRIHAILEQATAESLIILNETFGSTSLDDGRLLGTSIIHRILRIGALSVYVTFIDELTTLDASIVSMKSLVDPDDVTVRTFKVERHPADGKAYALALARMYRLDHESIRKEVGA